MAEQLVFDLPSRPSHARGDFFVSPSNAEAVSAIDRTAQWPNGRLALVGPKGAGKTHLVHVWADVTGAATVPATDLRTADIAALAGTDALAVEDWEHLGDAGEAPAFHLINLLAARGAPLLMTAREAPTRWPVGLADLRSRLAASGVATISAPDDALLTNLVVKLFADRQLTPEPQLIPWLVARMERSAAAVDATVAELDRAALAEGRKVTRALARRVLDIGGGVAP